MNKLFENPDGANHQAQAVLGWLRSSHIEESWSAEEKKYKAEPVVSRWHNCREQGYVISLTASWNNQLNIIFYEHRNSDQICAIKWEEMTLNPPNIDTLPEDVFTNKSDYNYSVDYGEIVKMADWIMEQLTNFWVEKSKPKGK